MDESKLRQQAERGERARRLLEDGLIAEAFVKIEAAIREGWENSEATDHEGRHNAYLMGRLLRNLRSHFTQLVVTGKHASGELLRIESAKKAEAEKKRRNKNAR